MADREAARNPGGRRIDCEAAFAFYASLPVQQRDYQAVADEFDVSRRTVERYGREGRWRERVRAIEARAHDQLDEQLVDERSQQLARVKKLVDASFIGYAQQLASGNVRFTPAGFVSLVKLLLEQLDEPHKANGADSEARTPERSYAHKREVLRALKEAGAFDGLDAALDQPGQPETTATREGSDEQHD